MAAVWCSHAEGYELATAGLHGRLRLDRHPPGLSAANIAGWRHAPDTPEAQLALEMFVYRAAGQVCCRPVGRKGCTYEHVQRQEAVTATYPADSKCPVRLTVHWRAGTAQPPNDADRFGPCPRVDLLVEAQTDGRLRDFECLTRTVLQAGQVLLPFGPGASQQCAVELGHWMPLGVRRVVFPRDAHAARLSYDGRCPELDTTLTGPAGVAPLVVWRLPGDQVSYVEMCHVQDGARLILSRPTGRADRGKPLQQSAFGIFGQDLEKGVILRGRLRGVWIAREGDLACAATLFQRFLEEPAPLTG